MGGGGEFDADFQVGDGGGKSIGIVVEIQAGCAGFRGPVPADEALFESKLPECRAVGDGDAIISEGGMESVDLGGLLALGPEISKVEVAFEVAR